MTKQEVFDSKDLMEERRRQLEALLNIAFEHLEPQRYDEANHLFPARPDCVALLDRIETKHPKLGLADGATFEEMKEWKGTRGMSTLSLIATITDVLADRRLGAVVDKAGRIIGWQWYPDKTTEPKPKEETTCG